MAHFEFAHEMFEDLGSEHEGGRHVENSLWKWWGGSILKMSFPKSLVGLDALQ